MEATMYQVDFTIEEFSQRRRKLAEQINSNAVALIPGADTVQGFELFRQYNDFYYLCGVEAPHCYLLINGKNGDATLFLPQKSHLPFSADNAAWVKETTGLEGVQPLQDILSHLSRYKTIYLPEREGEGLKMSPDTLNGWRNQVMADPLDVRRGRMGQIAANLRNRLPFIEIPDLSPIMNELRSIKSAAEITLLRKAGELTGKGALAAMKATKPGIFEYHLNAAMQKVYLDGGARGEGYVPIIPGSNNAGDAHYHYNNCVLEDGDIVLLDCAPDYHYYTSDIGRMWPVNGKFDEFQRALYGFVVEYHKTVLSLIKPGVMKVDLQQDAANIMQPIFDNWEFVSVEQRETAKILLTYDEHISHGVGMCVHDVNLHNRCPFEAGMVFAVDPMAWDSQRDTYYRVEDTVVVTENGCENLTTSCPIEIDDIEHELA